MRIRGKFGIGMAALIFGGIFWLFFTTSGLNTALKIIKEFVPGKLVIVGLNGRLAGGLTADSILYQDSSRRVQLTKLQLNWDPFSLLQRKLTITKLNAASVEYKSFATGAEGPTPNLVEFWHHPHFPLRLNLEAIELHNITVESQSQKVPLQLTKLELALQTSISSIEQLAFAVEASQGTFKVASSDGAKYHLQWQLNIPALHYYWPKLQGNVQSHGDLVLQTGELPTGSLQLTVANLNTPHLMLSVLTAQAQLAAKGASNFSLQMQQGIIGNYALTNFNIRGTLHEQLQRLEAQFLPFSLYATIGAQTHRIMFQEGVIKAKFPDSLSLEEAKIFVPALNVDVRNINIALTREKRGLALDANATAGRGSLRVHGTVIPNQKTGLSATATISGNELLVSNSDTVQIHLTPELQLKYARNNLAVTGRVTIPEAYISPHDFSTVVTLPDDVVFVKRDEEGKVKLPVKLTTNSDINLVVGDKVYLHIAGLRGRIHGRVRLQQESSRPTTASGMLTIKDGSYTIYGQKLALEQGEVTFAGGPVANPQLDIKAVRTIRSAGIGAISIGGVSLKVGIQIGGMVPHPKVTLYSEPAGLSQTDILSYLLTGQPAATLNNQQAGLLLQAASMLNFGGSGGVSQAIAGVRDKFGLAQLGLASGEPEETSANSGQMMYNTAFVLGKYLSPTLYISYSVGLFTHDNTVTIRKSLGKHWAVQTESGTLGSGADILYNIER